MVLNKEVQFNDWLFTHLHKLLVDGDFVVESEKMNKEVIPNVMNTPFQNMIALFIIRHHFLTV